MKKPESPIPAAKPVRGKYANLLKQGSNVVVLDSDLLESFPDSPSVNRALRAFLAINQEIEFAGSGLRTRRPAASVLSSSDFDPRVGVREKAAAR